MKQMPNNKNVLTKEQRLVLTAYTGCFMITPDELPEFYAYMTDLTHMPIETFYDLLTPAPWIVAKANVTEEFMNMVVPEGLKGVNFTELNRLEYRVSEWGVPLSPTALIPTKDELLKSLTDIKPETVKQVDVDWAAFVKKPKSSKVEKQDKQK